MLRVLSLFAREERPNNRNYNQGYYEADDNKAGTCFNIVHEFITARTKNQSIGGVPTGVAMHDAATAIAR